MPEAFRAQLAGAFGRPVSVLPVEPYRLSIWVKPPTIDASVPSKPPAPTPVRPTLRGAVADQSMVSPPPPPSIEPVRTPAARKSNLSGPVPPTRLPTSTNVTPRPRVPESGASIVQVAPLLLLAWSVLLLRGTPVSRRCAPRS